MDFKKKKKKKKHRVRQYTRRDSTRGKTVARGKIVARGETVVQGEIVAQGETVHGARHCTGRDSNTILGRKASRER